MFGGAAKIPVSNIFDELAGMDFVDYGDCATFSHIRDTISRFPVVIFPGANKKGLQTAEMVKGV